jgi:Fur family transcriptional regulator, ferric uptake regulator
MPAQAHQTAAERLRRLDQRYTRNRQAIVDTLGKASNPLTIPDILAVNKKLAMSSVYRNLALLEQAGIVHRIVTSDEFARYELAEDLTDHHHHHLICLNCGKVEDFTASKQLEESARASLTTVAAKAGFSVRSHRLDVLGICRNCA